jgi:hypothetical protein
MVGRTIGKYRVVAKLGRGGMGTVYRAVDETLDREVAIKILNPEFADSDVMKRFRAEASMLAKLNHPAIATIYELHRSDEDLLMVMEFVPGESLDQFVQRNGPVEPERAAYLLAQVLDAIGHAHAAGIIHRDLKPSNVMVTERGAVKIMDFGIARVRGAEHMTTDGYMMGTPAYMSPEQVLCQEVDGRSDLYSVGVMFYRLLTGKLPFEADTAIGMVQKQISDMPTPARLHRADLPAWAVSIVDRALAKSPADRYQTAEELRKALLDAIHDAAVEAKTLVLPSLAGGARWAAARPDPNAETSIAAAPPRPAPTEFVVAPPRRVAPAATPGPTPSPTPSATPIAAKAPAAAATPTAMPAYIVPTVAAKPPPMSTGPTPQAAPPAPVARTALAPKPLPFARKSGSSQTGARAAMALIAIATLVIGIVGWRRSQAPAPTTSASAETAVSSPAVAPPAATADPTPAPAAAEPTTPPAIPVPAPTPWTPAVGTAVRTSSATSPGTTLPPAGTRPPRAARGTAPPPPEPPPAPPPAPAEPPPTVVVATTPPKPVVAPVQFRAKILVKEDDKSRERDATVRLGEGQVTVTGPDRAILGALPYEAVLSVIYSKSKQPLWDGPAGATPIQQVDGGAFGFLKGGRHWVSLRTKERFIVLRVEENQVASVLSLIEERTGKTTVRVAEPKGNQ